MSIKRTGRDVWGTPDKITGRSRGVIIKIFGLALLIEWWRV